MNTFLRITAIMINIVLLTVATTNILTAPAFMAVMILVSSTVIFFVGLDMAESLKKVKV